MHYIRFLRPPKLVGKGDRCSVELVLIVTTDLGDSLYQPGVPLPLQITLHCQGDVASLHWTKPVEWTAFTRILKPTLALPFDVRRRLSYGGEFRICAAATTRDHDAGGLLFQSTTPGLFTPVMSAWAALTDRPGVPPICTRRLRLSHNESEVETAVELEEEIGESIARHIWDAGLMALCAVAASPQRGHVNSDRSLQQDIRDRLTLDEPLRILELGCGVGILGLGFAAIRQSATEETQSRPCEILMTDLPEAEERVRANIRRLGHGVGDVQVRYENLDWEDGREGRLPPLVQATHWDVIIVSDCTYNADMLDALVSTLNAVEENNARLGSKEGHIEVFMAMKPRHASEEVFFDIMRKSRWGIVKTSKVPLEVEGRSDDGEERSAVELYLFRRLD